MLVSLTVGKVDAGVTVLLTPDKRLVRVPISVSLPRASCSCTATMVQVGVILGRKQSPTVLEGLPASACFQLIQHSCLGSLG